jgi:ubiquinone/menaquinone biosynthesis C-methylase UbiE
MDLEHLPTGVEVTAIDAVSAMVRRTEARGKALGIDVDARVGDARSVPFDDDTFDAVVLHLVLSVVPDPDQVVTESARVLDSDGRVSIYDKFVPEESHPSLLRRAVNPAARFLFADLNRQLEPMVADTDLDIGEREPFLGGLYTVTIARPTGVE